jgi:hypothetical protein
MIVKQVIYGAGDYVALKVSVIQNAILTISLLIIITPSLKIKNL